MSDFREGHGEIMEESGVSRPSTNDVDYKVNLTRSNTTSQTSKVPDPASPLLSPSDVKFLDLTRPEDKGNVVYFICTLWGIGVLLPWNSILSTFDFFGAEVSPICLLTFDFRWKATNQPLYILSLSTGSCQ